MPKIKSITTKTGDKGTTRLFSGEEVSKSSLRIDSYGDIDELASVLGVARCHSRKKEIEEDILFIQRELNTVAAELATTPQKISRLPKRLNKDMLNILEEKRESLETKILIPDGFVVPGGSLSSASLDHARTIARRCERKVAALLEQKIFADELVLIWLKRLSDYLYLMARVEEDKPTMVKD